MNFLTDEEKAYLKALHKKESNGKVRDRIKAVLLYDKGWAFLEIADALLLSEEAVRHHFSEYKSSKKLKPESGGSEEKLSREQADKLSEHLQKHIYLYAKDIIAYVKFEWNVTYTERGMQCWLERHGFAYKKPAIVPGKANEEAQKAWIEAYNKLKNGLPEDETIGFIDGVHPTHNVQSAYGWIKKGERKEIPANSGRSRINLSGMIDIISQKLIVQEDKTLNAAATISFFQKIEVAYPTKKKIHLFSDNAGYYKNKDVLKYLETSRIELHFLPPYSPNLNPIERLWKWMKERVMYNTYYKEFYEFKLSIFGFFKLLSNADSQSELGQSFRNRVRDKFSPMGKPACV
jgi:transposase